MRTWLNKIRFNQQERNSTGGSKHFPSVCLATVSPRSLKVTVTCAVHGCFGAGWMRRIITWPVLNGAHSPWDGNARVRRP